MKERGFWQRFSLSARLTVTIMTPLAVVLIGLIAYLLTNKIEALRVQQVSEIRSVIRAFQQDFNEILNTRNASLAADTNRRFEFFPSVEHVFAFDVDGNRFHAYRKPGEHPIPAPGHPGQHGPGAEYLDGKLILCEQLVWSGRPFGQVCMRVGQVPTWTDVFEDMSLIWLTILILIALSVLLAIVLRRTISQPIMRLSELMRRVTSEGKYELRVNAAGTGEIGDLERGFDEMLATTQSHIERAAWYQRMVEDSLNEVFVFRARDLRIISMNRGAREHLGYELDDVAALTPLSILPEFSVSTLEEVLAPLRSGSQERIQFETSIERKSGDVYPVELHLQMAEFEGTPVFVGMALDMSVRVQAQEERKKLEQRMRETQKLESLGLLAGGIAHDFNNLLTGLIGHADLAKEETTQGSKVRLHLAQIESASLRASELCKQLLAYSGKGRFVVKPVSLSLLAQEMLAILQLAATKNARLKIDLPTDLPAVECDSVQIRQVILNLITNAAESTESASRSDGEILLSARLDYLDARSLDESFLIGDIESGDFVCLEVQDNGRGMGREVRARIFEPFFTTKRSGRGLGLSAVLGIVRGHRGTLQLHSQPGQGSTFRVYLPASEKQAQETAGRLAESPNGWRKTGTVLVVDDEADIREVAMHTLSPLGFDVVLAKDGMQAIECFEQHRDEVVLVVLDVTLPRMRGDQVFHELRSRRADVCVLVSSGYSREDTMQRFGGMAGFLPKPYSPGELVLAIRRALGESESDLK